MSNAAVIEYEAIQNAPQACLLPWLENPYRLVSLLDLMKVFEAHKLLSQMRSMANQADLLEATDRATPMRRAIITGLAEKIEQCGLLCQSLELPMSALHATQLLEQVTIPSAPQYLDATGADRVVTMLSITIENELSLRQFFAISPDKSKFYDNNSEPFGADVAVSFRSTSFDATEAKRCFALGRNTACVFHLMRVLEIGLRAFAKQFGKPADHSNWHNIIEEIEKAIRKIPDDPSKPADWKDQQEYFSQAASNFMIIKDAWRNYTAHVRGKYTDEEAETLLINVRAFMQKLALRLHE